MHGLEQIKRMNEEAVARHEQTMHLGTQPPPVQRVVVEVEVVVRVMPLERSEPVKAATSA